MPAQALFYWKESKWAAGGNINKMSNDIYIIKDNAEEDEEDLKELMKVG